MKIKILIKENLRAAENVPTANHLSFVKMNELRLP